MVFKPIASVTSVIMILMKIRLLDVVSSSVSLMHSIAVHETESDAIKCPKKRAMLRSRLVSYR